MEIEREPMPMSPLSWEAGFLLTQLVEKCCPLQQHSFVSQLYAAHIAVKATFQVAAQS